MSESCFYVILGGLWEYVATHFLNRSTVPDHCLYKLWRHFQFQLWITKSRCRGILWRHLVTLPKIWRHSWSRTDKGVSASGDQIHGSDEGRFELRFVISQHTKFSIVQLSRYFFWMLCFYMLLFLLWILLLVYFPILFAMIDVLPTFRLSCLPVTTFCYGFYIFSKVWHLWTLHLWTQYLPTHSAPRTPVTSVPKN